MVKTWMRVGSARPVLLRPRDEAGILPDLLCRDRRERTPFHEHSRVVDGFEQKSDSPAVIALALDLADPALKWALLDLDAIALAKRGSLKAHKSIRRAARANAGDNFVIHRNRDPAGAQHRKDASCVTNRFERFAWTEASKEISGKERLDDGPPAAPDDPLFAQLRQENLGPQRADVLGRDRLPARFGVDDEPVRLLPRIHLEEGAASDRTCAISGKPSIAQANSTMGAWLPENCRSFASFCPAKGL